MRVPAAAIALASAVMGTSAAAAGAEGTWRPGSVAGWESVGALTPGRPARLAAGGDRVAVVSAEDGLLRVLRPDGPPELSRPPAPWPGDLAYVGRRLLRASPCAVHRSDDDGRTWTRAPLPGCVTPSDRASASSTLVAGASAVVLATYGDHTWRSLDAGQTWTTTPSRGRAPTAVVDPATWVRLATDPPSGAPPATTVLERTADAGATWQRVELPSALRADGTRGPAAELLTGASVVARGDGRLLAGAGRTVLVSTDGAATFAPRDLPAGALGTQSAEITRIVCEPAGRCVVGAGRPAPAGSARGGVLFDGADFGEAVDAPPEQLAVAPAPGVVVGLTYAGGDDYKAGPVRYRAVRSDALGADPYAPVEDGYGGRAGVALGLPYVAGADRVLRFSVGGGASFTVPTPMSGLGAITPMGRGGGAAALGFDGALWSFADGRWTARGTAAALGPVALLSGADGVLVVGTRGILRLRATGAPERVRHPAPDASSVQVHGAGRTVLLAGRRGSAPGRPFAYRSRDGGRRWVHLSAREARSLAGVRSLVFVDDRAAFGLRGDELVRSMDGGHRFRRVGVIPRLDVRVAGRPRKSRIWGIAFGDRRRGVARTAAGLLRTDDGGRRWRPVPTPFGASATQASMTGGRVIVALAGTDGLWRTDARARRAPRLTVDGVRRTRSGAVARGRLRGAPAASHVVVAGVGADGRTTPGRRRMAVTHGRFAGRLAFGRRVRAVRAWYLGAAEPTGVTLGATSAPVRVR